MFRATAALALAFGLAAPAAVALADDNGATVTVDGGSSANATDLSASADGGDATTDTTGGSGGTADVAAGGTTATIDGPTIDAANGGEADAAATGGEVAVDEVISGGNIGNDVLIDDTIGGTGGGEATVVVNGGDASYATDLTLSADGGSATASAVGGDDVVVGLRVVQPTVEDLVAALGADFPGALPLDAAAVTSIVEQIAPEIDTTSPAFQLAVREALLQGLVVGDIEDLLQQFNANDDEIGDVTLIDFANILAPFAPSTLSATDIAILLAFAAGDGTVGDASVTIANGGIATADASGGSVDVGAVVSGDNSGNLVTVGDTVAGIGDATVDVDGGVVDMAVEGVLSADGGDADATANGSDGAAFEIALGLTADDSIALIGTVTNQPLDQAGAIQIILAIDPTTDVTDPGFLSDLDDAFADGVIDGEELETIIDDFSGADGFQGEIEDLRVGFLADVLLPFAPGGLTADDLRAVLGAGSGTTLGGVSIALENGGEADAAATGGDIFVGDVASGLNDRNTIETGDTCGGGAVGCPTTED